MTAATKPEVFIIESLTLEDEQKERLEGKIIQRILRASNKHCEYYYLRTRKELEEILQVFWNSQYRYLHISCHGTPADGMRTTFDAISLQAV